MKSNKDRKKKLEKKNTKQNKVNKSHASAGCTALRDGLTPAQKVPDMRASGILSLQTIKKYVHQGTR